MIPSAKTIERAGCDRATALKIRRVLDTRLDPGDASEQTRKWVQSCYHTPSDESMMLHAADCLLENHGVEGFEVDGRHFSYSNAGDTYATTLIFDHSNAKWIVASWGDIVEKLQVRSDK